MKKFTKIILGISTSGIALLLVFVIIIATVAMGILAGSDYKKDMQDKEKDENSIEHFEITGTKRRNTHTLNFIFPSWKIEGIKAELVGTRGQLKTKVKVPDVSGSYEQIAYQVIRKKGYTHAAVCGIMGNIWAESGFNPCAIEGENSWTSGKSQMARGYGFCQWTNVTPPHTRGRRTNVINWLKKHGYNPYKRSGKLAQGQIKYMLIEPGYDGARAAVKKETDIARAADIWLRKFEGIYNFATFKVRRDMAFKYSKYFSNYENKSIGKMTKATLDISFDIKGNHVTFTGTLDGVPIAGNYDIKNGRISGTGEYGEGASAEGDGGFSGTLTGANAKQKRVVLIALSYKDPYSQGFAHMCELWVYTVYRKAGLNYRGSCCASHSRDKNATKRGKIPIGAAIYSGNSYHSTVRCSCGRNAGHVAIYIGNGMVAGSQVPFKMTIAGWKRLFGYGGWYFPK